MPFTNNTLGNSQSNSLTTV